MKRFFIAALGCGTSLFTAVPAMANNATIEASGTMPGTCEVGGANINLMGSPGGTYMFGSAGSSLSTNGKSTISLSKPILEVPAGAGDVRGEVLMSTSQFNLYQISTGGAPVGYVSHRIETPLTASYEVVAQVSTDLMDRPLAAGFYRVTSTLTCVSDI